MKRRGTGLKTEYSDDAMKALRRQLKNKQDKEALKGTYVPQRHILEQQGDQQKRGTRKS